MNVVDSYDNKPPSKSAVRVELEAVIFYERFELNNRCRYQNISV